MSSQSFGKVVLLIGKVACGKTTFARKMEREEGAVFLSIDEMHLDLFGPQPTRDQIDSTYSGCRDYQQRLATTLVKNGVDVYLDWGFWECSTRQDISDFYKELGIEVRQYYFDIPLDIRLERNQKRNQGSDQHSFKIEEKDVAFFDEFFEEPDASECDRIFKL
ncbi:AAA family ATPase [Vibrio sp. RC27]